MTSTLVLQTARLGDGVLTTPLRARLGHDAGLHTLDVAAAGAAVAQLIFAEETACV